MATDLQQPCTSSQPQLANPQQQPGHPQQQSPDLMSPPLGEDLLGSLGEPSEPGWSEAIEQSEQVGTLVGDESEMQVGRANAGTLP